MAELNASKQDSLLEASRRSLARTTMILESLRVLFAVAAYRLIAHLMDATNAYVGSQIDKRTIMPIPQGVEA